MAQIKRIELKSGDVRYQVVLDVARDPITGKRKQQTFRRRTQREARAEHARIKHESDRGTYVRPSKAITSWASPQPDEACPLGAVILGLRSAGSRP